MKRKKFLWAWATYVAITFALGALWHLALFKELYVRLAIYTRIDDPIIPLGLLAMMLEGAVLAYVYPLYYRSGSAMRNGLVFGILMGIFIGSSAVLAEGAKQRVTSLSTWLALESTYYILQFALSGMAIGLIYGKKGE